ncbi:MAG: 3-deoxy-7-phosphoheptulonate synthase [Candidatus Omnitrophica bacterium]|nr:3-deoxy-7-phosphoheptulonate synthase [Candidatus Omnitrophota bacterium]
MSFEYIRKIPSPEEILRDIPMGLKLKAIKAERDQEIADVFTRQNNKFLLIIGPCSADDENSVCEYVSRLAKVQEKVKDVLVLVPRIYTNKPRTTGEGYKGMAHQPDPNEAPNIVEGIKAIRRMHLRVIEETGLTAADEMLYPTNYPYLADLLSYVAVGARSVENQNHRLTASGLDIPVGMKNPTSGDLTVMLNAVHAAVLPHVYIYNGFEVKTSGNPLTHCILRGAVNLSGRSIANYHFEDLTRVAELYKERGYPNPAIIVDTNHSNSNKQFKQQTRITHEIMWSRMESPLLKDMVRGLMIESYLVEGAKPIGQNAYGQSITDPCLGWGDSEKLIHEVADYIRRSTPLQPQGRGQGEG